MNQSQLSKGPWRTHISSQRSAVLDHRNGPFRSFPIGTVSIGELQNPTIRCLLIPRDQQTIQAILVTRRNRTPNSRDPNRKKLYFPPPWTLDGSCYWQTSVPTCPHLNSTT